MKTSGVKPISRYKQFLQKNYKHLILFAGLSLLNIFFLCWSFASNGLSLKSKSFIFLVIGSLFAEIVLCIILFIAKARHWKIEKVFLVLGLSIGILYVFAIPPGRAPDESSHFFRIYEITNGKLISDLNEDKSLHGSIQPSNIYIIHDFEKNNVKYYDVFNSLSLRPDNSEQSFIVTSAGNYHPIEYTPHIIGMLTGKILNLPLLITIYIAKLFNCIACILILYFCIKYIPILKEFVFFTAFLPITMQSITSLSADGFIIATAIALISFVLYTNYTMKTKLTKKHILLLFILCLILSLSKVVYAMLCFLLFAIPRQRFKSQKNKIIIIFTIGIICFIALFSWLIISSTPGAEVDPTNHNTLFHNPILYLSILIKSFSANFSLYLNGALGGFLEWFNVVLSPLYLFPSLIIFVIYCYQNREKYYTNQTIRILSAVIFLVIAIATFTAMYTGWTKPGETTIDGVQGRYFLPILLLIPLFIISAKPKSQKLTTKPKSSLIVNQNYYIYGFFIFESIYAIATIACTHI